MRAVYGAAGIIINLDKKDHENVLKNQILECKLEKREDYPSFYLHIVDNAPKNEGLEESGFHIEASEIPEDESREQRDRYDAYLSKKRFEKMVTDAHEIYNGYFLSRSWFDRIEFLYWNGP